MYDYSSASLPAGEVAVSPDVGEPFEVGSPVAAIIGIVPELQRHRWERSGTHQFAFDMQFVDGSAVDIEHLDVHSETFALKLPNHYRLGWITSDQTPTEVGAAADRSEMHVARHRFVHPCETIVAERRTG